MAHFFENFFLYFFISQALFNYWIYEELVEREEIGQYLFGPYYKDNLKENLVTYRDTVELYLLHVEDCRIKETYKHFSCTGNKYK